MSARAEAGEGWCVIRFLWSTVDGGLQECRWQSYTIGLRGAGALSLKDFIFYLFHCCF